jgi:replicative DNA helicase
VRAGARVVVLDYTQACVMDDATENRNQEIARMLRRLGRASAGKAVLVIASQLNRIAATEERPDAHHLRDSGVLEQDAHAVLLLHRPKGDSTDRSRRAMELIIAKNKNGDIGSVPVTFHTFLSCIAPGFDLPTYAIGLTGQQETEARVEGEEPPPPGDDDAAF